MSGVKWGVTVLENGKRARVMDGDRVWSSTSRHGALSFAGAWGDDAEARIVKLTSKPKGWQPIETAPKGAYVLVWLCGRAYVATRCTDGVWFARGDRLTGPTHWRHLPKGPK